MRTVHTVTALRQALDAARREGATVGLVPTMGYLHAGHRSLIEAAAADCDIVATTLFVNPLQFGAGEDLAAYPRDLDRDRRLAEGSGTTWMFVPDVEEMYPEPPQTKVSVESAITSSFEGASRPTHLGGVTTVVAKLFNIAGSCRAYFGEKDWQQLAAVRRMATDLSAPVTVVGCPTVREADGLALSSRNAYLTPAERAAAPVVHAALEAGREAAAAGERSLRALNALMASRIRAEPLADLDYAEVVDAASLDPVDPLAGELRALAAVRFGKARLIDNVGVAAGAPDRAD